VTPPFADLSIGRFGIHATDTHACALLGRLNDDEAKQRGMVAAIMGAPARPGVLKERKRSSQPRRKQPKKKDDDYRRVVRQAGLP
jgi:hypothetical protein